MNSSTEKILVYASILVIVVSLASIGMEFTGFATDIARVNITILTSEAINFTNDNINFGVGVVTPGQNSALIQTNGSGVVSNGNWTTNTNNLTLANIGNVNVSLNVSADKTAATLLGGTAGGGPLFQFMITSDESGACNSTQAATFVNLSTTPFWACDMLQWIDTKDQIAIDIGLRIPTDSSKGVLGATITATGTIRSEA